MMKVCSKCKKEKPLTEFGKHNQVKSGLRPDCRACKALMDKRCYDRADKELRNKNRMLYYKNNKEHILEGVKERYYKSPKQRERQNLWKTEDRKDNPEKWRAIEASYRNKNREKLNYKESCRRAKKLQATPKWANLKYIELFYKLAKIEEARIKRPVDVDHIVPLQGKTVCGLHCEDNLQLLLSIDNRIKYNKLVGESS